MLLAQAAESMENLMIAVIGGLVALGGQWSLQQLGLRHRVSEQLWSERLNAYREVIDSCTEALFWAKVREHEGHRPTFAQKYMEFAKTLHRVRMTCSPSVNDAMFSLGRLFVDSLKASALEAQTAEDKLWSAFGDLIRAIRADLSVPQIEKQMEDLFRKLPADFIATVADKQGESADERN